MERLLDLEDWIDRETYEGALRALGGADLEGAVEAEQRTRRALEQGLRPEQRVAWLDASEAGVDLGNRRERAAIRVALTHGIAIGAALASSPERDAGPLARTAAGVASALLSSDLEPEAAMAVHGAVVCALQRMAAMHLLPAPG